MELTVTVHDVREFDVVVAGGGPSGVCAAIAAAREGVSVALIESHGFLGGAATVNLVGPIQPYFRGNTKLVGGIADELVERLRQAGGSPGLAPTGNKDRHPFYLPFDPEILKKVLDEMVADAGGNLYFHTNAVSALKEKNRVTGILGHSAGKFILFKASYFLDATGNADIVWYAGGPFLDDTEDTQAMGMMFRLGAIKRIPGEKARVYGERMRNAVERGDLPGYRGCLGWNGSTIYPDEVSVNMTRIHGDPLDVESVTRAEIEGRTQVWKIVNYYRENMEEYKDCRLLGTGDIGIRESRRIKGLCVLDEEDVLSGARPQDTIALGGWGIDIHGKIRKKLRSLSPEKPYGIPYRCLVPEVLDNVLVVGRAVSCTHLALGSVRLMPQCMAMGEAGGIAAAMAFRENIPVADVDVASLQEAIKQHGGIIA